MVCAISGKSAHSEKLLRLDTLRPSLAAKIRSDYPDLPGDARISTSVISKYRLKQVEDMLREEGGELSNLEQEVAASIAEHGTISSDVEEELDDTRTLGARMADGIASFGGSWVFITTFFAILMVWMLLNSVHVLRAPFDPYPFILLNLVLSCLAAVQAPIIMMSQNRQDEKDRVRSQNDYQINLKAELEIRLLHEKLDHLIMRQWERLSEIQSIQTELLHDLSTASKPRKRR